MRHPHLITSKNLICVILHQECQCWGHSLNFVLVIWLPQNPLCMNERCLEMQYATHQELCAYLARFCYSCQSSGLFVHVERKVKTLTRNRKDHCRTGTRKLHWNILTVTAVFINQKRANASEHTTKMVSLVSLWKVPSGVLWEGNYLRLMPGPSLEDRTNW